MLFVVTSFLVNLFWLLGITIVIVILTFITPIAKCFY